MAINLHTKYSTKIVEQMKNETYLQGKVNEEYKFDGVKSIVVTTLVPQELNDYQRTGVSRYGTPQELQDTTQTMSMTKDRSFSMTIDKGNNNEQQMIKSAGKALQLENNQIVIPEMDKYAFGIWIADAVKNKNGEFSKTLADGDAILSSLGVARAHFTNNKFKDRSSIYCYMGTTNVTKLLLAKMILGIDSLAKEQVSKGVVGQLLGFPIVEVPDDYLANTNFICCAKNSVLRPIKLNEAKVHQDPPGISGNLLEGRYMYDAFVLDTLNKGLFVSSTAAAPTTK